MKKLLIPSIIACTSFALLSSSCNDAKDKVKEVAAFSDLSVDNIGDNAAKIFKDVPSILSSVKDEKTLDAAGSKLDAVGAKVKMLMAAASKLPKPAADKLAPLGDKMSASLDKIFDTPEMKKATDNMKEFAKNNPNLEDKVSGLKKKFKAATRPLKNIFDEDGALGTKK